jgi:hypothetical protein
MSHEDPTATPIAATEPDPLAAQDAAPDAEAQLDELAPNGGGTGGSHGNNTGG